MTAEFKGLMRSLKGTLSSSETSEVLEFVEAGDPGLALQALCGILLDQNKRVTPELFGRIHSLVRQIDGVDPNLIDSVKAVVRAE